MNNARSSQAKIVRTPGGMNPFTVIEMSVQRRGLGGESAGVEVYTLEVFALPVSHPAWRKPTANLLRNGVLQLEDIRGAALKDGLKYAGLDARKANALLGQFKSSLMG